MLLPIFFTYEITSCHTPTILVTSSPLGASRHLNVSQKFPFWRTDLVCQRQTNTPSVSTTSKIASKKMGSEQVLVDTHYSGNHHIFRLAHWTSMISNRLLLIHQQQQTLTRAQTVKVWLH